MKKAIWWLAGSAMLAAVLLIGIFSYINGYFILAPSIEFQLIGSSEVEISAHSEYTDAGFLARKGKKDLSDLVTVENTVDSTTPGTYTVRYRLTVTSGEYLQQRTVRVVDTEAPVLELLGETEMVIPAREFYVEAGYVANDRCDGDLTSQVRVTEEREDDLLIFTYLVCDAAGNESRVQRRVTVRDEQPPVIHLYGLGTVYVPLGGSFREPGYRAEDDVDGDLTSTVTCSGGVDTSSAGTYTIRYCVSDKGGNVAETTRTVKVYSYTPNAANKLYLTFDDGPSSYVTGEILDTLAAHHVQATFFILNYSQADKHLISRMIREGHTVAIHGYSHDYAAIYANDEAFMQNVYRLRDKLLADFGYDSKIIRFPGGSSNTVSAAYNSGIMSRLVKRVQAEGFSYFDWNVSSGDANAAGLSSYQIYQNVTSCLRRGQSNVVLMHDTNAKQTTADALENMIHYAKANGYTFLPITPDTAPVRHSVAN